MKKIIICFGLLIVMCSFCIGCSNRETSSVLIETETKTTENTSADKQEKVIIHEKDALNQGYIVTNINSDSKALEMKFDEIMRQTK